MGKHSGEREPASPRRSGRGLLALHAVAITATLVAWGFLVWVAIDFGADARAGSGLAWLFLALATIGAAACLFTTMLLGSRMFSLLRGADPSRPAPRSGPRPPGGRRAAR